MIDKEKTTCIQTIFNNGLSPPSGSPSPPPSPFPPALHPPPPPTDRQCGLVQNCVRDSGSDATNPNGTFLSAYLQEIETRLISDIIHYLFQSTDVLEYGDGTRSPCVPARSLNPSNSYAHTGFLSRPRIQVHPSIGTGNG